MHVVIKLVSATFVESSEIVDSCMLAPNLSPEKT